MVALFTVSNLLHFTLGVHIVNRHAAFWPVFRNPMVIATFAGFAFALLRPEAPEWLMLTIKITGDAMIPLMLISLGVRMATVSWGGWNVGVIGALVCPLTGIAMASLVAAAGIFDQSGLLFALPPAVLNSVAERQPGPPCMSIVLIGKRSCVCAAGLVAGTALTDVTVGAEHETLHPTGRGKRRATAPLEAFRITVDAPNGALFVRDGRPS
jgi:predicted permease